jgi:short subunit fatty acids transporter
MFFLICTGIGIIVTARLWRRLANASKGVDFGLLFGGMFRNLVSWDLRMVNEMKPLDWRKP